MSAKMLIALCIIFSMMKFYKNRVMFKELSLKEWLQYIIGLVLALTVATIIIIGGGNRIESIEITWLNIVLKIGLILIGLLLAGWIMNKTIPEKVRAFYS